MTDKQRNYLINLSSDLDIPINWSELKTPQQASKKITELLAIKNSPTRDRAEDDPDYDNELGLDMF